ncbi:hypothetical protein ACCO45_009961 [Purpureocillium lilacinum]|uniref:Uncharacterized protein n=1 Tax=Purpureocillium lilacinum TaxID=33203 RepID=A0ACC4DGG7_PURLI
MFSRRHRNKIRNEQLTVEQLRDSCPAFSRSSLCLPPLYSLLFLPTRDDRPFVTLLPIKEVPCQIGTGSLTTDAGLLAPHRSTFPTFPVVRRSSNSRFELANSPVFVPQGLFAQPATGLPSLSLQKVPNSIRDDHRLVCRLVSVTDDGASDPIQRTWDHIAGAMSANFTKYNFEAALEGRNHGHEAVLVSPYGLYYANDCAADVDTTATSQILLQGPGRN